MRLKQHHYIRLHSNKNGSDFNLRHGMPAVANLISLILSTQYQLDSFTVGYVGWKDVRWWAINLLGPRIIR